MLCQFGKIWEKTVILSGLTVLIFAFPALGTGEDFTPAGSPYDVDYVIPNTEVGLFVLEGVTVNLLPGAHVQGGYYMGDVYANGTLNIYGGVVDGTVQITETSIVTIYGSDFVIDDGSGPVPINPSATVIENPNAATYGSYAFTISCTGQDSNPISYSVILTGIYNTNSFLYLNQAQPEPDIQVYYPPDFGTVEIGSSTSGTVQIYNFGNADLVVNDLILSGSTDFQIASITYNNQVITELPLTVVPSDPTTPLGVDIEITFTPSVEDVINGVLTIESNDPDADEASIDVPLSGAGIIVTVPPEQQIQNILDFYDNAVEIGSIVGYGPGNSPDKRLKALRNMIEAAGDLINDGNYPLAIQQLESVAQKTDGENRPPDFVMGGAVAELNQMILDLIADLQS